MILNHNSLLFLFFIQEKMRLTTLWTNPTNKISLKIHYFIYKENGTNILGKWDFKWLMHMFANVKSYKTKQKNQILWAYSQMKNQMMWPLSLAGRLLCAMFQEILFCQFVGYLSHCVILIVNVIWIRTHFTVRQV